MKRSSLHDDYHHIPPTKTPLLVTTATTEEIDNNEEDENNLRIVNNDNILSSSSTFSSVKRICLSFLPALAGIYVNIIFGGYSVVTAIALKHGTLNPIVYAFLRDIFASCILLTAAYIKESKRPIAERRFWIDKEDLGYFILIGLLMVWGAQGMSALAIANLTPSYFSLLSPLMPVVTLSLAFATRLEKFRSNHWSSWGKVFGLLICVGGAVTMGAVNNNSSDTGSAKEQSKNWTLGNFYLALQLTLGGSFPVIQKMVLHKYSALTTAAWGYAYGSALLSLSVATCCMDAPSWDVTSGVWIALAYSSILSSAVNYFVMAWINQTISPVFQTAFIPLQGVAAVILSYIFLSEVPTTGELIGGSVVIGGLFGVVYSQYHDRKLNTLELHKELSILQPINNNNYDGKYTAQTMIEVP